LQACSKAAKEKGIRQETSESMPGGRSMESGAPDRNLIDALNAIDLNEEELFEVIKNVRLVHKVGAGSQEVGEIAQKEIYEKIPSKTQAILTRLQALSVMIENNELNRWLLADGASITPAAHKALVSAAANHPLSIINGDIAFEKESFLQKILELVEPEGSRRN
jgi:hypothetical protein